MVRGLEIRIVWPDSFCPNINIKSKSWVELVVKQSSRSSQVLRICLSKLIPLFSIFSQYPNFKGVSFDTISAVGPHGAIIHYRPEPETDSQITTNELYLLDSGGQYLWAICRFLITCETIKQLIEDVTGAKNRRNFPSHSINVHARVLMACFFWASIFDDSHTYFIHILFL